MKNQDVMLEHARDVFCSHWDEMLRLRRVVLKDCLLEDIHDLRVASRRFRAAFTLLEPLASHGDARVVVRRARRITRTLGTLRNLDEAQAFFSTHQAGEELSPLLKWLSRQRKKERQLVLDSLKAFKPRKLDPLVREVAAGLSVDNLVSTTQLRFKAYLSKTSLQLFGTIQTLLPEAMVEANVEERHALRIAIKKWRYFLEITARIVQKDYGPFLEQLKAYQTHLGGMNDLTAFARLCREAGLKPGKLRKAEQMLDREQERLWSEFVALAAGEPLANKIKI